MDTPPLPPPADPAEVPWPLPDMSDPTARRRAVEQTRASFALEGILSDEAATEAQNDFIEGRATPEELRARLDAKYGVH